MNGMASQAFDLTDVLLGCLSINIYLLPGWTAGIQAVPTLGRAIIVGYQTSGIEMVYNEFLPQP
jgi:hypothetical protein